MSEDRFDPEKQIHDTNERTERMLRAERFKVKDRPETGKNGYVYIDHTGIPFFQLSPKDAMPPKDVRVVIEGVDQGIWDCIVRDLGAI